VKTPRTTITWRPVATHPLAGGLIGSTAALAVGAALIPLRDVLGAVNVALVMAGLTVVAAEFGGRMAGVVVGAIGSLVFNVFHTEPYLRLVIERPDEAVAAAVLVVFGLLVGTWHRKDDPESP
jgi:K+-sensing histidine kinase KdpD